MSPRILHALSQRPSRTGSGVTLEALARHAEGWTQTAVIGVPGSDPHPEVGGLAPDEVHPLVFESDALPFPVPGMSDIMPYRSTRWSDMTPAQLDAYRAAWRDHLSRVVERFQPDVIHTHHLWLMSSVLRDVAPDVPMVAHCHATGLRQRTLCPHLADEVNAACARIERFVTLSEATATQLCEVLGVAPDRVTVVGAGYRDELFTRPAEVAREGLVYIGKYSHAKGVPWLLDAYERLAARRPGLQLHVVGSGAGEEADALRRRMEGMAGLVLHGQVDQPTLAGILQQRQVCVLPSLYEGVPLVLVEALACGNRLVSTALPGVLDQLAPHLGDALSLVDMPRLATVDVPEPADLPAFVDRLEAALDRALDAPPPADLGPRLHPFTWGAVYERVAPLWRGLMD